MTNVASLELCKELYELSGWRDTDNTWAWYNHREVDTKYEVVNRKTAEFICPAYDLGYLLRKLPDDKVSLMKMGSQWFAWVGVDFGMDGKKDSIADTPEDCVAKLVIALFKAGVLK